MIDGTSRYTRFQRIERVPTLEELIAQITPENRRGETDWGPDVGKEIVEWEPAVPAKGTSKSPLARVRATGTERHG
jgi:hypothetical protein